MVGDRPDGRRHDLDALRVCCFGTLIIYHSSLVYGAKTWWVHASDTTKLIDLITIGSHPWRMSLLFFISGVVTASLLKNRSVAEIRTTRTRQLLLPFVFGVFVVVPPQIYFSPYNFTPAAGLPSSNTRTGNDLPGPTVSGSTSGRISSLI